jgi:polyisoprenoid-binding protein YceI
VFLALLAPGLAAAQSAPAQGGPSQVVPNLPIAPVERPRPSFAAEAPGGQSLVIPLDQIVQGRVYHALPGRDRQVFFTSDAPAESFSGQSNRVIGYTVALAGASGGLAAGEWHLPVDSIRTGIPLRDQHLTEITWLDVDAYPAIIFQLREFRDHVKTQEGEGFATWTGTMVGDMTIHGVTRPMEIPDTTVTFLAAGPRTESVAAGDLLAIRSRFEIQLKDFGIANEAISIMKKVAEIVRLDISLYMSTVPPEQQPKMEPVPNELPPPPPEPKH